MKSPFGSDWASAEPMSDINIVPLVDVLLVLLVIFMITAPIISQTLDVQLPRATLAAGTRADQTLVVSVDQDGQVAVNETVVGVLRDQQGARAFEAAIQRWKSTYPGTPAFLRADRRLRYGQVIQVMAELRRLGVADVGLMIEREGR